MGNLAKISDQPGQLTQWSEPLLPVKLNAAVESNESLFDLPVPAPHHRAALQAALDAGEPPLPSLEQVENMLGKLAIALPKAKIDDAEADARLEIYWSALRDIPLPDLRQAYDRLLKTSRFFPTIEEIRAAAHPSMAMRSYKRMRMQMLITRHDREWQPDGEPLTDAERREMQKIIPGSAAKHERTDI